MRQIAITDIHGCRKTFEALLEKLAYSTADKLYLLGDYIDRGPDSKGVIDFILTMKQEGYQVQCLRGNHEQMLLELANQPEDKLLNLYSGLVETLISYGCRHPRQIPQEHLEFMSSLDYHIEENGFILVHAGINFSAPEPLEDRVAMLWERYWYPKINKEWLNGRIIIHGHTPISVEEVKKMNICLEETPVLNLDSGCVYQVDGMHHLTALDLTNRCLYFQENVE